MSWREQLITIYLFICAEFDLVLKHFCQRMSNNATSTITDSEIIAIYIFGILKKQKTVKDIYTYTADHLMDWFPKLGCYENFIQRLNRLGDVFVPLIERLQAQIPEKYCDHLFRTMDSIPIIMAQRGRRFKAKVAPDLADPNGYCSTKNLYYYGAKVHVIGAYKKGSIPTPEYIGMTSAGVADRKAYEQILPTLDSMELFADKAYQIQNEPLLAEGAVELFTPVKKKPGQKILESADKLLSTAISRIRQPVESFFNWVEEKTKIQMASKVRSAKGLIVHVFGRLAAAFFSLANVAE